MGFEKRLLDDIRSIDFGPEPAADFDARQQVEIGPIGLQQSPARGVFPLLGLNKQIAGVGAHAGIQRHLSVLMVTIAAPMPPRRGSDFPRFGRSLSDSGK